MARPSLVKAETSDCNLSWGRQIKAEAAHLSKTDREDTHYDQINVFFGKKNQAKPNQNKPPQTTTKNNLPPSPPKKNPQNTFYQHVLLISGLQAMRRVFQAPKLWSYECQQYHPTGNIIFTLNFDLSWPRRAKVHVAVPSLLYCFISESVSAFP